MREPARRRVQRGRRAGAEVDPSPPDPATGLEARDVKAVMDVRRNYPFMGKARIHATPAECRGLKPECFLMDVLGAQSFPLLSVQVDGGSENS